MQRNNNSVHIHRYIFKKYKKKNVSELKQEKKQNFLSYKIKKFCLKSCLQEKEIFVGKVQRFTVFYRKVNGFK